MGFCLVTSDTTLISRWKADVHTHPFPSSCWLPLVDNRWMSRWESIWMLFTALHYAFQDRTFWIDSFNTVVSLWIWMQGKVTIITGSAQGLGKAFAIRLLCAGAKVPCICYLKPFAIKKMLRACSIVFPGLPVRRQHRGGWEDPGGAQGEVWGGRGGLHQVLSWHDHDPQSPKSTLQWSRCDVTKTDDLVALYDNCEKHFGAKVMLSQLVVLKMLDILTFWNHAKVEIFCNNAGINSKVAGWKRWWSHLGWWWRWC